jgi:hypothetical protein
MSDHKPGAVAIKGVTTRHNTSEDRTCVACLHRVGVGRAYERVARLDERIESYHVMCFEEEFGARSNYGD